jgi:hypothetical protein
MTNVKVIQINVALGTRQRVDILADSDVMKDLCHSPAEYHHEGLTSVHPELIELVCQLGEKLCDALRNRRDSIGVNTQVNTILPDP